MALIVYASLYPFGPWQFPVALNLFEALSLRGPPMTSDFDRWSNVLGYLPLGALLFVVQVRHGTSVMAALATASIGPAMLSYAMEFAQTFVPARVPSRLDLGLNALGATLGAASAAAAMRAGVLDALHRWRERWFVSGSAVVIALLILWPAALLFPTPVPFGLGQVFDRLRELVLNALVDTPWAIHPDGWPTSDMFEPLSPAAESVAMMFGLLAPCALAFSIMRISWRRVAVLVGAFAVGVGATTLSTALNFGPQHALTWFTPPLIPALVGAVVLSVAAFWLPRRACAGVGLVTLTGLIALVAQAPGDPYYAQSLQAWEQGRFIRFHGLAQWLGWLWPFAALGVLLGRVAAGDES